MIRTLGIAVTAIALTACGPHKADEANTSNAAATNTAKTTADLAMFAPAASKSEAMKIHHDRHEGMEAIGKGNKIVKQELNASSPDLALVRSTAAKMTSLSKEASGWFHAGTGMEMGKTGAKPEIWQNQVDVAAKLAAFQKAMQTFTDTSNGNDVRAMKARFTSLAETCKACHDKYRSEMHH